MLTLLADRCDIGRGCLRGCRSPYTARQQSMGSGTQGVASERRPMVIADDFNRLLLYLMLTRPGHDVQVATTRYTLDHNQQDLTKLRDTHARQVEQEHMS